MLKVKTLGDLKTRPMTTGDIRAMAMPVRTVRNIRRGHIIKGMRDISHVGREPWEHRVAEQQRVGERQRFDHANAAYNAIERAQILMAAVQRREGELQTSHEELEANYEELQSTTEELEATNQELEHTGAYTRNLIESSLDPLVTINPEGKITDVNSATATFTGHSREELIGTDFANYFTEPEKARVGYGQALEKGSVKDYALELRHRDGNVTPVMYNAAVFRDEAGKVIGVFAAARDITKQRHTEEDLTRSNKELEHFAYVASHDLQEPLRMVSSYTQLLDKRYKGKLDADADEFVGYIVDGVSRMQAMINALLAYSRVGTQDKVFEPTDCNAVLADAVTNLQMAIEKSGAAVTHDPLPTVIADASQLAEVFLAPLSRRSRA